ncbi:xanthine dehydrogenase accessory protein XdhC [Bosea thiooxidans]|nr:xanthine dehydrogenase accessory protein XdhC [Bosea sp. (in: a-proteobacteria)]
MSLAAFLTAHRHEGIVLVHIEGTAGSTPREAGASMAVTANAIAGTIGGGQLEFHCIDRARHMLSEKTPDQILDIPLGPQMGQCCGGRVRVSLKHCSASEAAVMAARETAEAAARPSVLVFGAGHTGRALVKALAALPFTVTLVDDRDDVMSGLPPAVTCVRIADPVGAVANASANTAFVVLSHSHALDYRLAEAALARGDAAYVGMIGSATKRSRFEASFLRSGGRRGTLARLTCPIGGSDVDDKRPEVIAALTAAELVRCLLGRRKPVKGRRARHESAA